MTNHTQGLREAYARIIDPRLANEEWRRNYALYLDEVERAALAKADAILALPSPRSSEGDEADREMIEGLIAAAEALRPFADVSEHAKGKDDACWCGQAPAVIRYGDLRRAAKSFYDIPDIIAKVRRLLSLAQGGASRGVGDSELYRVARAFLESPNLVRIKSSLAKDPVDRDTCMMLLKLAEKSSKAILSLPGAGGEVPAGWRDIAPRQGVYVASRASAPDRPAMWRRLRARGFPIISTWIDEAGEGETACNAELWQRIEREVTSAERLVFYAERDDFPLKGAYVEVGMALAAGVPVFVVTPEVVLAPKTLRPLGSWAMHPLVTHCDTLEDAFALPAPPVLEGEGK